MSLIGESIADYMNGIDNSGNTAVGNAITNYLNNGVNTSGNPVSNALTDYLGNNWFGSGDGMTTDGVKGGWFNTLGRLGAGILGGIGDYQASSGQQAYLPYTQWLGNGLAKFSAINNTANKQNQINNAYGNTLMLSSLFGPGKSLLGRLGGQIGRNYSGGIYNDTWGSDNQYSEIEPRYTTGGIEWRDKKDVTI